MPLPNHCIECDKPIQAGDICLSCKEKDKKNIEDIIKYCKILTKDKQRNKFTIKNFYKEREVTIFYNGIRDELITVAEGDKVVFGTRDNKVEYNFIGNGWLSKVEQAAKKSFKTIRV